MKNKTSDSTSAVKSTTSTAAAPARGKKGIRKFLTGFVAAIGIGKSTAPKPEAGTSDATLLTLQADEVKQMQSYVPKLNKVLPATKVIRYLQIENKIRAVIKYEAAAEIPLVPEK
jgi:hypothetical protein